VIISRFIKKSIVHRLSISFVVLVLISSGIVGGLFYKQSIELRVKHALDDIAADIRHASQMLQTIINTHDEDVLFLANTPPIQGMLHSRINDVTYKQWRQRLEKIFESQLQRKSSYLSIRFINEQGQELVHVYRTGSRVAHYSDDKLQNKSNRTYVREALKLKSGAVYVSEINLNREFGKVVTPYQEVKRSTTPVFDSITGKLAGLVVITAEIGRELRAIQEYVEQKNDYAFYVTNDQGGYLLHPDSSKTYGFDRGKRFRIQKDIPQLAKLYLPENNDSQLTLMPDNKQTKKVINFTRIPFDPENPKRFIAVILSQDYDSIVAAQSKVLNYISLWGLLLALVGAAIGVLFAIHLTRPLKQMASAMDGFSHQKPTMTNLPIQRTDEIGVLARSFTTMTHQVNETRAKLQELNNSLEKQIYQRTHSLEVSEDYQRTILESIADAIITIDNKGIVTSFNLAAEKIFLYQADEVIGKNVSILLPEKERHAHHQYVDKAPLHLSRIINKTRDLKGRRKDGSTFPLELKVTSIKGENQRGFVGVLRDITERIHIEQMKGEFISTVSHELRTPLTSIHGAIRLMRDATTDKLPEQVNKLLKIADNNTNRLLWLINDLLNIQKIESDQTDFDFKKLEVMPFIEQVVEDNTAYSEQYGVKFIITQKVKNVYVLADKERLTQVMVNFLSNAAKFSPKEGNVEVSVDRQQGWIRVSISNHGPSIPKEFYPRLFEKFTQSDSSDSRQKGGTGLGLSIARGIINKHKGKIDFNSNEETTSFYFDLLEVNE